EGSRLELQGGSVEFDCTGRYGETRIQIAAGRVVLHTCGTVKADSASGNVVVGEVTGTVDVKSASGNVTLGQTGGDVRLIGASSDINLDRALSSVGIKLASGNVRIGSALRGSVSLHAASGGLELGVPEGTAAKLDVTSGSGRVHSSLPPATGPDPADQLLEVPVRTGSGDVRVHRA